jgi:hypothetical protein
MNRANIGIAIVHLKVDIYQNLSIFRVQLTTNVHL